MRQVRALLMAIALAATACSTDTEAATEIEPTSTTEAPSAPVPEPVVADGDVESVQPEDFRVENDILGMLVVGAGTHERSDFMQNSGHLE